MAKVVTSVLMDFLGNFTFFLKWLANAVLTSWVLSGQTSPKPVGIWEISLEASLKKNWDLFIAPLKAQLFSWNKLVQVKCLHCCQAHRCPDVAFVSVWAQGAGLQGQALHIPGDVLEASSEPDPWRAHPNGKGSDIGWQEPPAGGQADRTTESRWWGSWYCSLCSCTCSWISIS